MEQGLNILGAHIDSPRLDLKQNPLYEAGDMAYLDTHYYGGVKAYRLGRHPARAARRHLQKDGMTVENRRGRGRRRPRVLHLDLLIHLAGEQMESPRQGRRPRELST